MEQPLTRRARYRQETREEAKAIALRQVESGGASAVSINAIGAEMGTTGPALYRYFSGRDALLTELIVDAYRDLAEAIEAVPPRKHPRDQLRDLAGAVRGWALAQPHRYLLIYGTPVPGYVAPTETTDLARRILAPILAALDRLPAAPGPLSLDSQLAAWADATGQPDSGSTLRRALSWWTRIHGVLSLEVAGHFTTMGFDPALLFAAEVESLLDS